MMPYGMLYGHSEFPSASYDNWKTTPPDYCDLVDEPECEHDDYDITFDGHAVCCDCPARWIATADETKAWERSRKRAERVWRRETSWYMRAWRWLKARCARKPKLIIDNDIPF